MSMRLLVFLLLLLPVPASAATVGSNVTENYAPVVAEIVSRGDAALAAYSPETSVLTGNEFSRLYFDVFESSGMEFTLGLKDNALMLKIESSFSLLISQSMRGENRAALESAWTTLKQDLDYADKRYSRADDERSFWSQTVQSFIILFREGIEAMLVVAALVAYLRRSGYADKVRVIWYGVGWALLASAVTAWLLNAVVRASGAQQEAIEGVTMLIASVVLLYVSYWLSSKRDANRWQAFIRESADRALGRGNLLALGFVAFLAVFREGAETILFYQALMAGASGGFSAIAAGMALALLALVAVYLLVRVASIRLPLRLFFGGTSVLLFVMAFVFTGQGILELQVSGLVQTNRLEGWPMLSWLGVFPTLETMLGQGVVLALLLLGWVWMALQSRRRPLAPAGAEGKAAG